MRHSLTCRLLPLLGACGLVLLLAVPAPAQTPGGSYRVHVSQVDRTQFPKITVYLTVKDARDLPVPPSSDLSVEVFEGEVLVYKGSLFSPQERAKKREPVAVVLVLDCSGSMQGEKFERAQRAARGFVSGAPAGYRFAVVSFDNNVTTVCPLTTDRNSAVGAINRLRAGGATALQDGIGMGLQLLRGQTGRRLVLTLTDGQENASKT
jgi:Mg-chelatase subunit ChlD